MVHHARILSHIPPSFSKYLMGFNSLGVTFLLVLSLCQYCIHGKNNFFQVSKGDEVGSCDLYQGRWTYSEAYTPYYSASQCRFIESQFDCLAHGRPDNYYLKYRWQPNGCILKRFNGQDFLSKLRGKSLMFVGDSLSLNQWQSLNCMLHVALPQLNFTSKRVGGLSIFTYPAYKTTIMFSRNAFLVDVEGTPKGAVLKIDSIEGGNLWKGIDVLVFNSWHWWLHTGRKQPWSYIQEGNKTYPDMDRLKLYEKALNTWARWVDANVDPAKNKVFFQGISPDHANASDWRDPSPNGCEGQERPYSGPNYPAGQHPAEKVLEKVLSSMSKPVQLLNVTYLSQLRKEGHPSVYGSGGHRSMDCSHWCLAGVPDTWNELLYASLG